MVFSNHREGHGGKGCGFLSGFPPFSFTVYTVNTTETQYKNCKRLSELEEIKISMQSCRGDSEQQRGKLLRRLSGFHSRIRPLVSMTSLFYGLNIGWKYVAWRLATLLHLYKLFSSPGFSSTVQASFEQCCVCNHYR